MKLTAFILVLLTIVLALISIRMTPQPLLHSLGALSVWMGVPLAAGFFLDRLRRRP
ncbi:hypothetical protein OKA05_02125 [Luteolibacter arcticus]|uniref:Uncharacterized protein n=1 Tax=Luteolibacter arcticus TaxID=1581411 RepID=A0ABT3GCG9_9BACT|nr:hypothetical protein [Luteolibacter arcticus]MCW1921330.1 hypothetical protein [Luteolibacter arcticus]